MKDKTSIIIEEMAYVNERMIRLADLMSDYSGDDEKYYRRHAAEMRKAAHVVSQWMFDLQS
jgi:hypothetical protein